MTKVRVRFAPSPTGSLHLGGIRSALYDYLFAQSRQGSFVLRIEDTDRERLVEGTMEQIIASLRWLGLDYDEGPDIGGAFGPYVQSDRLELYRRYADQLMQAGVLYPCWCTPERLADLRKQAQADKAAFKYDRYCLDHPQDLGQPHVLRFKVPADQQIAWDDAVRGRIEFNTNDQDDFVAMKSDGYPTYNFANVIDDQLMQISHVLRGDEFIASTPKHLLLFQAYGWTPPIYAHLPQVLGTDKTKLSKRHGAKSVLEYRDEGYLPEAVINFMALLGWNEGEGSTQEIYTRAELIKAFSLEGVNDSPAVFDPTRLDWLNGEHIRALSLSDLTQRAEPFWSAAAKTAEPQYRQQVLALLQDRLKKLSELPELSDFFFSDPPVDKLLLTELSGGEAHRFLTAAGKALKSSGFNAKDLESTLRALAAELTVKTSWLFGTLRAAVTGKSAAPGLFETMAVLGQEAVLRRLDAALQVVSD